MKRKLIYLNITIIVVLSTFLFSYQSDGTTKAVAQDKTVNPFKIDDSQQYDIIDSQNLLKKIYKNINQLKEDADLIIEGKVINTKSEMYQQHVPITLSQIEIDEVYKTDNSNVVKGTNVCVIDEGGVVSKEDMIEIYKDKFPNKPINPDEFKSSKFTNDGISPMEMGEHVIVFAKKFTGKTSKENCYIVLGAYQGKFKIENDNIEHPVPESIKNKFEDNIKTKKELVDKIKSK